MKTLLALILATVGTFPFAASAFDDETWSLVYHETFDIPYEAVDGQIFGEDGWLVYQLLNGASITVADGVAHLQAPDFWMAGLIHSTNILPDEYRIRTKIGYINYDLANYEQADLDDPDFNDHNGYLENGVYLLTLTDDLCVGNECAEFWWHWHRKMVIDVDNHMNGGGLPDTFHPIFMVYMGIEDNGGSQGHKLRTWDPDAGEDGAWEISDWNWNVAYTYEYDSWYYAEIDKRDGFLTLRLYDGDEVLLVETDPVPLDEINAMDDPVEYLYLGEPHTDDYEGDVLIDDITLLIPEGISGVDIPSPAIRVQVIPNPFNPSTMINFDLPHEQHLKLTVYSLDGKLVTTLVDRTLAAGHHEVIWRGKDLTGQSVASGTYVCRLSTGETVSQITMTLVK